MLQLLKTLLTRTQGISGNWGKRGFKAGEINLTRNTSAGLSSTTKQQEGINSLWGRVKFTTLSFLLEH